MSHAYEDWPDWMFCLGVVLVLLTDMALHSVIVRLRALLNSLSPLRKVFGVFSLLAIPYMVSVALGEQAASQMEPEKPILWFSGAAILAILFFWMCEELITAAPLLRGLFLMLVGIAVVAALRHEFRWIMDAADDAAAEHEKRDALESRQYAMLLLAIKAKPIEKQDEAKLALQPHHHEAVRLPNVVGGSLSSPDEPSERAALRVVAVKANVSTNGEMIDVTIYVQNVGKYIALPVSLVDSAIKERESAPLQDEGTLFDDAPDIRKKDTPGRPHRGPDWQRGGSIMAFQPWYPGDVRSLTAHDFVDPPLWTEYKNGARGWYVLTRAFFADKLGALPVRESCTFFSVLVPNGQRCVSHND